VRTKISSKGNISRELATSEFPETRLVRGVFAAISRQSEAVLLWQLDRKRDLVSYNLRGFICGKNSLETATQPI